ncbi:hypothetical protein GCM10025867_49000 (plasmid) [Frondihabitans sucicola]|uniref:Uncharacterized protein n=1 Tax=Frondihabitans sucicola TaxID=1268041 RepID=A0ABN6Y6F3_9MICO|nr:hypothetical protein [Frondihabitans sucicola]BDZ52659.1 hypothetical protein GCM10025867_49000 [Frondihabitans sucicola]
MQRTKALLAPCGITSAQIDAFLATQTQAARDGGILMYVQKGTLGSYGGPNVGTPYGSDDNMGATFALRNSAPVGGYCIIGTTIGLDYHFNSAEGQVAKGAC